jgi:hypothetical protein
MDNCQLPKCYPTALNFENDELYALVNTKMVEGFQGMYEIQEYDNPSGLSQTLSSQTIDETITPLVNEPGPLDHPLSVEPNVRGGGKINVINAIEKSSTKNNFLIIFLIIILISFICYINKPY